MRSIVIPRSAVGSLVNLLEKEDVVFAPASRLEELVPELIIRGSTQPGATADVHGEDM